MLTKTTEEEEAEVNVSEEYSSSYDDITGLSLADKKLLKS